MRGHTPYLISWTFRQILTLDLDLDTRYTIQLFTQQLVSEKYILRDSHGGWGCRALPTLKWLHLQFLRVILVLIVEIKVTLKVCFFFFLNPLFFAFDILNFMSVQLCLSTFCFNMTQIVFTVCCAQSPKANPYLTPLWWTGASTVNQALVITHNISKGPKYVPHKYTHTSSNIDFFIWWFHLISVQYDHLRLLKPHKFHINFLKCISPLYDCVDALWIL